MAHSLFDLSGQVALIIGFLARHRQAIAEQMAAAGPRWSSHPRSRKPAMKFAMRSKARGGEAIAIAAISAAKRMSKD